MGNPRMLVVFTLATAILVGVVVSLATGSWLFLVLAIGIHVTVSALVLSQVFKATNQGDKPDPVTEAHMDASDEPPRRDGLTDSGRRRDREIVL
jgi:membrane protein implicated in regulation of membrane protease activity